MRYRSLVFVLTAGLGGVAAAQPGPPPQPPPPPADTALPTDPPADPPPPPPQPRTVVEERSIVREEPAVGERPEDLSFALGIGYGLPTSLQMPNLTSLRLRLRSGLTFEPAAEISNTSEDRDNPVTMTEETDKTTVFALGVLGRLPVITHNKVDLEVLAFLGFGNQKSNPEGDYNTVTANTFGVGWGVGVGYWISRHWQFSMSITNPLVTYTQTKTQTGPGMSSKNGETLIGVIFDPDVFMMIHLYN